MAASRTGTTQLEELRATTQTLDVQQVESTVAALTGLLEQTGTRLCPAVSTAAADAALSLVSRLKTAQLQLAAAGQHDASAGLARGIRALLQVLQPSLGPATPAPSSAPPPAPVAQPLAKQPSSNSQRAAELSQLVRQLGFSRSDLQAAQAHVSLRTAQALHAAHKGSMAACIAELAQPGQRPPPLDGLLMAAVDTPVWKQPTGEPSLLHAAVNQLLWVLRQLPPDAHAHQQPQQLSAAGWAAYWMLEPRALQQVLAEVLQAATQQQAAGQAASEHSLHSLLEQQPRWAASLAAAACHPALHITMRRTLHDWLAASGNPAAWRLLHAYLQAARSAYQHNLHLHLPAALRVLYPPALSSLAARLLTEEPTQKGVIDAVGQLHSYLQDTSLTAGGRQVWQLLLDAPAWLLFCLRQLPLHHLSQVAADADGNPAAHTGQHHAGESGTDGAEAQPPATPTQPAAAAFVVLLFWPGEPRRRQVLQQALLLQLEDVDLHALRPWLDMLRRWQHTLAAMVDMS